MSASKLLSKTLLWNEKSAVSAPVPISLFLSWWTSNSHFIAIASSPSPYMHYRCSFRCISYFYFLPLSSSSHSFHQNRKFNKRWTLNRFLNVRTSRILLGIEKHGQIMYSKCQSLNKCENFNYSVTWHFKILVTSIINQFTMTIICKTHSFFLVHSLLTHSLASKPVNFTGSPKFSNFQLKEGFPIS